MFPLKLLTVPMQAVSLLLDDPVPFRFQWPRNAELKVNQMGYRVYSRQASSKIGNNVRDEPANLATTTFAGQNRIRLKVSIFLLKILGQK